MAPLQPTRGGSLLFAHLCHSRSLVLWPALVAVMILAIARGAAAEDFRTSPVFLSESAETVPRAAFDDALKDHERPTIILASSEEAASEPGVGPVPVPLGFIAAPDPGNQIGEGPPPVCQPFELGGDPELSFRDDIRGFLPRLGHDAWGLVNWNNTAFLGVALGGSLAVRSQWDDSVRRYTGEHPDRWGEGSKIIGDLGVAQYQIPVILGAYAFAVWEQDVADHEMMGSLISAYTLTGLSTVTIKVIADTKRPSATWNGGNYGFPSYHDASMFAMAAVLDNYEGHWVGVPMYVLSGLVGWSRLDTRDHDLSDVLFGAALGYVIGQSVSGKALWGDSRVHLLPYRHPADGSPGIALDMSY